MYSKVTKLVKIKHLHKLFFVTNNLYGILIIQPTRCTCFSNYLFL